MNIRRILIGCVLVSAFSIAVFAKDSNDVLSLFYQGNAYYRDEQFSEAARSYEEVVEAGFESGPLYYNLGNAYIKTGELGKAIANYFRAKRFIPLDADLASNLSFALSLSKAQRFLHKSLLRRIAVRISNVLSVNGAAVILIIIYLCTVVCIIFWIMAKESKQLYWYLGIGFLCVLCACVFVLSVQIKELVLEKNAVVIKEIAGCRFEPLASATTHFTLYEGERVAIITERDGWIKIERRDTKQGWVEREVLEPI